MLLEVETQDREALYRLFELLGYWGDKGLVGTARYATNSDPKVRLFALQCLAAYTDSPVAVAVFTNVLTDPDPLMRQEAKAFFARRQKYETSRAAARRPRRASANTE
jgi:hypothetical protein